MAYKKIVFDADNLNGLVTDLTAEEETQRVADNEASTTANEAREAEEAQKATDKASAKAKLIAGEALTEAEADTIVL